MLRSMFLLLEVRKVCERQHKNVKEIEYDTIIKIISLKKVFFKTKDLRESLEHFNGSNRFSVVKNIIKSFTCFKTRNNLGKYEI